MWRYVKHMLIFLYIQITGVRFYTTIFQPETSDIRKLVVRTIYGYDIGFRFYKEEIKFTKYAFRRLRQYNNTVYVICATYDDSAPEAIKKYAGVKVYINAPYLLFCDEAAITQVLLEAYIDLILLEFQQTIPT